MSLQHSSAHEPRDELHSQPASGTGCLEDSLLLAADGRLYAVQRHGHAAAPGSPISLASVHALSLDSAVGTWHHQLARAGAHGEGGHPGPLPGFAPAASQAQAEHTSAVSLIVSTQSTCIDEQEEDEESGLDPRGPTAQQPSSLNDVLSALSNVSTTPASSSLNTTAFCGSFHMQQSASLFNDLQQGPPTSAESIELRCAAAECTMRGGRRSHTALSLDSDALDSSSLVDTPTELLLTPGCSERRQARNDFSYASHSASGVPCGSRGSLSHGPLSPFSVMMRAASASVDQLALPEPPSRLPSSSITPRGSSGGAGYGYPGGHLSYARPVQGCIDEQLNRLCHALSLSDSTTEGTVSALKNNHVHLLERCSSTAGEARLLSRDASPRHRAPAAAGSGSGGGAGPLESSPGSGLSSHRSSEHGGGGGGLLALLGDAWPSAPVAAAAGEGPVRGGRAAAAAARETQRYSCDLEGTQSRRRRLSPWPSTASLGPSPTKQLGPASGSLGPFGPGRSNPGSSPGSGSGSAVGLAQLDAALIAMAAGSGGGGGGGSSSHSGAALSRFGAASSLSPRWSCGLDGPPPPPLFLPREPLRHSNSSPRGSGGAGSGGRRYKRGGGGDRGEEDESSCPLAALLLPCRTVPFGQAPACLSASSSSALTPDKTPDSRNPPSLPSEPWSSSLAHEAPAASSASASTVSAPFFSDPSFTAPSPPSPLAAHATASDAINTSSVPGGTASACLDAQPPPPPQQQQQQQQSQQDTKEEEQEQQQPQEEEVEEEGEDTEASVPLYCLWPAGGSLRMVSGSHKIPHIDKVRR